MEIKTLILGLTKTNCYLVSTDSATIVIDPGVYSEKIKDFLCENKAKQRLILITHAHFDHICGAQKLREETGTDIAIGEDENTALSDSELNLTSRFHAKYQPFSADILLSDNSEISVGDIKIKTVFTPGHTKGSVCYLIDGALFSGDTIFFETVGRTDFPGGNCVTLHSSVKKLMEMLDDDTTVLSGHGPQTTIGHERNFNPYI